MNLSVKRSFHFFKLFCTYISGRSSLRYFFKRNFQCCPDQCYRTNGRAPASLRPHEAQSRLVPDISDYPMGEIHAIFITSRENSLCPCFIAVQIEMFWDYWIPLLLIQGLFTYDDSCLSTYLVDQTMTKSGLQYICGHQDYDL